MQIIDYVQSYWFLIALSMMVMNKRSQIENFLGKYETGKWIMSPIMIPYFWYLLYRLATNEHFIARIQEAKKQKKITDYI